MDQMKLEVFPTKIGVCLKMSSVQNPGCWGYIGDYTTQLYGDYNKPI